MKKLFYVLLGLITVSALVGCNDDCTTDCYLQEVYAPSTILNKDAEKTAICHYDADTETYQTLYVNANGLKGHANHPNDDLTGACQSLGVENYMLVGPKRKWSIPCDYNEETIVIDNKEYYIFLE
jgi:hypothetical protein